MSEWREFECGTPDNTPEHIEEFLNSAPPSIGKHWLIKTAPEIYKESGVINAKTNN